MSTHHDGLRLDNGPRTPNGLSANSTPRSPNGDRPATNGGEGDQKRLIKWRGATFERQPSSNGPNTPLTTSSHHNASANASIMSNEIADFFGPEVFQIVLHNPTTAHQLLRFSKLRFCGENMEFLDKVRARSLYAINHRR